MQSCVVWTGGGDADGTDYANAVCQASFRGVAVAANDVAAVFQQDAPELSSLFLVWALQETQRYVQGTSCLPRAALANINLICGGACLDCLRQWVFRGATVLACLSKHESSICLFDVLGLEKLSCVHCLCSTTYCGQG